MVLFSNRTGNMDYLQKVVNMMERYNSLPADMRKSMHLGLIGCVAIIVKYEDGTTQLHHYTESECVSMSLVKTARGIDFVRIDWDKIDVNSGEVIGREASCYPLALIERLEIGL